MRRPIYVKVVDGKGAYHFCASTKGKNPWKSANERNSITILTDHRT